MPTTFRGRRAMRKVVQATKNTLFPGVKALPAVKRKAKLMDKKNRREIKRTLIEAKLHSRRADRAINRSRSFFNPLKWIRAPFIAAHIFRLKRKGKYQERQIAFLNEAIMEVGEAIHAHNLAEGRKPLTFKQLAQREFTKRSARIVSGFFPLRTEAVDKADIFARKNKVYFAGIDPRINTVLANAVVILRATTNPEKLVLISAYFSAIQQSLKIKDTALTIALVNNLAGVTP